MNHGIDAAALAAGVGTAAGAAGPPKVDVGVRIGATAGAVLAAGVGSVAGVFLATGVGTATGENAAAWVEATGVTGTNAAAGVEVVPEVVTIAGAVWEAARRSCCRRHSSHPSSAYSEKCASFRTR